jgi:L-ribulokinase
MRKFSIGFDFGTNSVRALLVDISNGEEICSHVYNYKSGVEGVIIDPKNPHLARQNPMDYILGLEACLYWVIKKAKKKVKKFNPQQIIGIGIDTTGSTPIPVNKDNQPLSFDKKFKNNPNAMAWLWKDHTSSEEAEEITELANKLGEPYLSKCGGVYSSEWFWSKILHCLRTDPKVFDNAYSWVELADYIPSCPNRTTKTRKNQKKRMRGRT